MSGTLGALRLIERTSARLCHALGGSVGRLNQALSAQVGEDTALADAAKALTSQLHLRQAAWGPANQPVSLHHLTTLAHGLPDQIGVDLSALPPGTVFPASSGRIVLNLLLLAADSLPEGGRVVLAGTPEDLFVRIDGRAAAWPAGTTLCLVNEAEAQAALTDGRNPQMAFTALLAHAASIRLSALLAPTMQNEPAILRLGG
jgi:histidine phosphotransferase ChpT